MAYIPPTSHAILFATVRRNRLLAVPGEVLAADGQRVEPATVVARAVFPTAHRLIDLARELGVPPENAHTYLVKEMGDTLKKNEVLAQRKTALGLGMRQVRAPVEGRLEMAEQGQALLSLPAKPIEVRAGFPGLVVGVVEGRGVAIETTGALLSGVWGNGQTDFAVLRVLGNSPAAVFQPEQIDMNLRGAIWAVGVVTTEQMIKQMQEASLRGLIIGTAPSDLLPHLQQLNTPVLIVEGFGTSGFSEPAFQLLTGNAGREVCVNAEAWDRFGGQRPEVIIPLPAAGQTAPQPAEGLLLTPGQRVRVIRGPEAGQVGTLVALLERSITLPSGVRAQAALVEITTPVRTTLTAALANLEVLD